VLQPILRRRSRQRADSARRGARGYVDDLIGVLVVQRSARGCIHGGERVRRGAARSRRRETKRFILALVVEYALEGTRSRPPGVAAALEDYQDDEDEDDDPPGGRAPSD